MGSITRRQVNLGGIALSAAVVGFLPSATSLLAQGQPPLEEFMAASRAITGRANLDPAIGARFLAALDAATQTSLSGLTSAVNAGTLSEGQQKTAQAIMRAWYTGMVGKTVVTFEQALMFEAVADVLPVRSYCHGAPGFWASNPNV